MAQAVFDQLPPALRPAARSTQLQKAQEELQQAGAWSDESKLRGENNFPQWSRRPNIRQFNYCGVDEFSGAYYIQEVKNKQDRDGGFSCEEFKKRAAGERVRSCRGCEYEYRAADLLIGTLERMFSKKAYDELRREMRQFLEGQVVSEYEDCVAGDGVLRWPAGLLPICQAWSTEGRYVVGPIVNAGERCEKSSAGTNEWSKLVNLLLKELQEKAREYETAWSRHFHSDSTDYKHENGLRAKHGHAEADIIEFCLVVLGAEPGFAASIAFRYLQPFNISNVPWASKGDSLLYLRDPLLRPASRAATRISSLSGLEDQRTVETGEVFASPQPQQSREKPTAGLSHAMLVSLVVALIYDLLQQEMGFNANSAQAYDAGQWAHEAGQFLNRHPEAVTALANQISAESGIAVYELSGSLATRFLIKHPERLRAIIRETMQSRASKVEAAEPQETLASLLARGQRGQALRQLLPGSWRIEESALAGLVKNSLQAEFSENGTLRLNGAQANWSVTDDGKLQIWSPGKIPAVNEFSEIQATRLVGTVRRGTSPLGLKTVWFKSRSL